MFRRIHPSIALGIAAGMVTAASPCEVLAHGTLHQQIAALGRQIAEHPGDAGLYSRRGDLHRRHRDWARALTDLDRAAELDPLSAEPLRLRGKTYLDSDRAREAETAFERYLAASSAGSESRDRRASVMLLLGRAARRLGRPLDAADWLRRGIDLAGRPGPQAFLDCARAFDAAGEPEAALSCLDDGLERLGPVVSLERAAIELEPRALERPDRLAGRSRRDQPRGVEGDGVPEQAELHTERAGASGAGTVGVTRGPYLQRATPTSLVVRWRTDIAVDSRVSWGDAPTNLTDFADDPALSTEHEVEIIGLLPATTYFYAVGTTGEVLAGADAATLFLTPPLAGPPEPTRVWVIGDSGTANSDARAVRDAYLAYTGSRHTDLWLMLGDNAYGSGTDAQYQAAVFDTYPSILRRTVLWPTLGNHDGISADSATQTGPYYDIFTLPALGEAGGFPSGTEAYYSFDHGNLHFIVLESHETDRSVGGAMMSWLAADAAATAADWVIAYWHHPPYTKGSHNSDLEGRLIDMRENALPIIEGAGVDLVLTGHSHSYERSFLLDSHYGDSSSLTGANILDSGDGLPAGDGAYRKPTSGPAPHEGAIYAVAGSSGRIGGGSLDHPAMFISLNRLGSMVLDFDVHTLDAVFLDHTGAVADAFTIIKGDCAGDAECDDGAFCNGIETCTGGACLPAVAPDCDDGVDCTVDGCNEDTDSCDHSVDNALCDDGAFCNGAETCDLLLGCQPGADPCAPLSCDACGVCGGDNSTCGIFADGFESGVTTAWLSLPPGG